MEKTRSMKEEMDGEVFVSRQIRHFSFLDNMIKVLFSIVTLNWRINKKVSCKENVRIGEAKIVLMLHKICGLSIVLKLTSLTVYFVEAFSLIIEAIHTFVKN